MKTVVQTITTYESDDGQFLSSIADHVLAYERHRNPLAGMHFPYTMSTVHPICAIEEKIGRNEAAAVVAFANLAPKIAALSAAEGGDPKYAHRNGSFSPGTWSDAIKQLFLAYDEAVKLVPNG